MASYSHLGRDNRVKLAALLRAGHSQKECAEHIGVSPSTISRELARHGGRAEYTVWKADKETQARRVSANNRFKKIEHRGWLVSCIVRNLKKRRSPEQIAGLLKKRRGTGVVCHETIYAWIYAERPDLKKYLRQRKGKYRRRGGTTMREKAREQAKKRRIDERPTVVEERTRIGDWEGDTILSGGSLHRILTFVERRSGYLIAILIENGSAVFVKEKTIESFLRIAKSKRLTLTLDNGIEFSAYELIERATGMTIYFAHPYHSWERGTNENTNGLLRQYFPKRSSFADLTQEDVDHAVHELNHRPRKRLGYRTPRNVFRNCTLD